MLAWYEFWLPVLSGLAQQCCHPAVEIRYQALVFLQRLLLSDELCIAVDENNDLQNRIDCFDIVIFPVMDDLCNMQGSNDAVINGETFTRAASMITKVFLCFSGKLAGLKDYTRIWTVVLNYIVKMQASIKDISVIEQIHESVKNAVLVLLADQILVRPGENETLELWDCTWKGLESISPRMMQDLKELAENAANPPSKSEQVNT
jgi:hypothetical protein